MEIEVQIKPMSVNQVWRGKRWKTKAYEEYEMELLNLLPLLKVEDGVPLRLKVEFGISKSQDIDNGLKPLIDILQKKYKFNDRYIMELIVKKTVVKKADHFIKIKFEYI